MFRIQKKKNNNNNNAVYYMVKKLWQRTHGKIKVLFSPVCKSSGTVVKHSKVNMRIKQIYLDMTYLP